MEARGDNNKHSEENEGFQKDHWASWGFTCFTHGITEAQHGEYFFYKACIKTEEESTSMTKKETKTWCFSWSNISSCYITGEVGESCWKDFAEVRSGGTTFKWDSCCK